MLSKITGFLYCLLAFLLAFGSANIFELGSLRNVSEAVTSQNSYSPILFATCALASLFDKKVISRVLKMGRYIVPLMIVFIAIVVGEFFYDITGLELEAFYYLKLFVAFTGFIIFSIYFAEYPVVLARSLNVFAWTCTLIVIAYFLGLLDPFSFFSNGRLWLFGENPNSFSFLMGVGALVHLYSLLGGDRFNVFRFVSILIILFYIILSGSRGSFIICLFSMGIVLIPFIKKHFIVSVVLALVISCVAFVFVQSIMSRVTFFERMSTLTQEDERQILLTNSFSLFEERPFCGFGRHGYTVERLVRFNDTRDAHNVLVSVLAMGGFFGGVALFWFIAVLFNGTRRVMKKSLVPLSLFVYVSLISMKTGEILTYSMMWYTYAVVFAYSNKSSFC